MKIIYLTLDFLKPIFSGNGTLSRIQILHMAKRGHHVMVICPDADISKDPEVDSLIKQGKLIILSLAIKSKKNLDFTCDWKGYYEHSIQLLNIIQSFNPDIIISIDWHTIDVGIYLKQRLQKSLITEFFRIFSFFDQYFDNKDHFRVIRDKEVNMITQSDLVLTLSNFDEKWVNNHNPKAVETLYPPVLDEFREFLAKFESTEEEEKEKKEQNEYKLLTLARLVREKKTHRIFPIIKALAKIGLKFKYTMVGEILDPKYFEFLNDEIKRLGIEQYVFFDHSFSTSESIKKFKSADCYIHTSEYEPFGITIIEAALCKCPVILDGNGLIGAAEILISNKEDLSIEQDLLSTNTKSNNHINGAIRIDYSNLEKSADLIRRFLLNRNIKNEVIENGFKLASKLETTNYIDKFISFLENTRK